jgi:type IV pilus assembly protein PilB
MNNTKDPKSKDDLVAKAREYLNQKGINISASPINSKVRGINNLLDALLAKGIVNLEQYNSVKFESINTNKPVEELLKMQGIAADKDIVMAYAEMQGIGFVSLDDKVITSEVLNKLPASIAKSSLAVVFEETPGTVKVAMKDPLDLQKIKYLESVIGKKIESFYAVEDDINRIIDTKYGAQIGKEVDEALEQVGDNLLDIDNTYVDNELQDSGDDSRPIIRIVNMILDYGIKHKASDIHIEPREGKIAVRFRIRGILSEKLTIPRKLLSPVISRIKILSNLKIDEHRIPQDGRFQAKTGQSLIDIRVSIMPSIYGEKIVMRLLEKSQGVLTLEDLGMRGVSYARLRDALKRTQGIILVTGPTGSGKTQTLASCLKILNTSEVNIVTLEDPVEVRVEGVNQVQVNSEVGLTFAQGLRSFLRQDPDIIMVGEIRDSETANLAVQSALVGRLVLSTIHTNSAAGAFVRMIDMGVEPFLLSSTVNLAIGQRLVRVLCECKQAYEATSEVIGELHKELDVLNGFNLYTPEHKVKLHFDSTTQSVTLYKAVGCPKCNDSGYISRTGIFEALKMSENIAKAVRSRSTISDVHNIALKEGMITMAQDGFIKALEGITTIEEVLRVRNE